MVYREDMTVGLSEPPAMLDFCAECGAEIFRGDEVLSVDDGLICKCFLEYAKGFKTDLSQSRPLLREQPGIPVFSFAFDVLLDDKNEIGRFFFLAFFLRAPSTGTSP